MYFIVGNTIRKQVTFQFKECFSKIVMMHNYEKKRFNQLVTARAERRKTSSNSKKLVSKNMTGFSSKTLQFSKID